MGLPVSIHVRGAGRRPEAGGRRSSRRSRVLRRVDACFSTWRAGQRADAPVAARRAAPGRGAPVARGGRASCAPWRSCAPVGCSVPRDPGGQLRPDRAGQGLGGRAGGAPTCATCPGSRWCVNAGGDLLAGTGRRGAAERRGGSASRTRASRVAWRPRSRCAPVAWPPRGAAARGAHVVDPRTGAAVRPGRARPPSGVPPCCGPTCGRPPCSWTPSRARRALGAADPAYRSLVL